MFKWLRQQRCKHKKNYTLNRYVKNNTPMVKFECYDCGYVDQGPVYTSLVDWEKLVSVRNGEVVDR